MQVHTHHTTWCTLSNKFPTRIHSPQEHLQVLWVISLILTLTLLLTYFCCTSISHNYNQFADWFWSLYFQKPKVETFSAVYSWCYYLSIPANKYWINSVWRFLLLISLNGALCAHFPNLLFNPFNPEFTIVIFIHYKPRIAVAILDL